MNRGQRYIHSIVENQRVTTGKVRVLILKGRQMGCTTYIQGRYYWRVTHNDGMRAFILTHEEEATNNLFEMAKRYHEYCLPALKPTTKTSNAKELLFDKLDSGYKLGTAGNKSVGRSSTIQFLHASEAAFYKHAEEHAKGIMQTVPDAPGTEIFIESTANGVGNWFHQQWQQAEAGLSDYIPIFIPWFWQDEYKKECPLNFEPDEEEQLLKDHFHLTNEQLAWRRSKISDLSVNGVDGKKSFNQEYPNTASEAFVLTGEDSFIPPALVMQARKALNVDKYGHKIIGVDPARFGDDRSAIVIRQGRAAYNLQTYIKKDTMEITGFVYQLILAENPDKVCIDVGGLGAGIVDRLKELVDPDLIVGVNSGSGALNSRKYLNKRAEMWALGKQWLEDEPCLLPDSDELQADICNTKYTVDSNSRLVIEKKEQMKKRGVRSSDCFVAGTLIKTPKGDIAIELLNIGDEVVTPFGITKIIKNWISETDAITTAKFSNGSELKGKGAHKIFTWKTGETRLDSLSFTFEVEVYSKWKKIKWWMLNQLCITAKGIEFKALVDITKENQRAHMRGFFTAVSGKIIMEKYQKIMSFIIKIITGVTMIFPIWKLCYQVNIIECMRVKDSMKNLIEKKTKEIWIKLESKLLSGIDQKKVVSGINNMEKILGLEEKKKIRFVLSALKYIARIMLQMKKLDFALNHVVIKKLIGVISLIKEIARGAIKNLWQIVTEKLRVAPIGVVTEKVPMTNVYNLTLEKHNVYYANEVLVFNCADAFLLTFSVPQSSLESNSSNNQAKRVKKVMSNFTAMQKISKSRKRT